MKTQIATKGSKVEVTVTKVGAVKQQSRARGSGVGQGSVGVAQRGGGASVVLTSFCLVGPCVGCFVRFTPPTGSDLGRAVTATNAVDVVLLDVVVADRAGELALALAFARSASVVVVTGVGAGFVAVSLVVCLGASGLDLNSQVSLARLNVAKGRQLSQQLVGSEGVLGHVVGPQLGISGIFTLDHVVEVETLNSVVDDQATVSNSSTGEFILVEKVRHGVKARATKSLVLLKDFATCLVGHFTNRGLDEVKEILGVPVGLVPTVDAKGSQDLVILEGSVDDLERVNVTNLPGLVLNGFGVFVGFNDGLVDVVVDVSELEFDTQSTFPVVDVVLAAKHDKRASVDGWCHLVG